MMPFAEEGKLHETLTSELDIACDWGRMSFSPFGAKIRGKLSIEN